MTCAMPCVGWMSEMCGLDLPHELFSETRGSLPGACALHEGWQSAWLCGLPRGLPGPRHPRTLSWEGDSASQHLQNDISAAEATRSEFSSPLPLASLPASSQLWSPLTPRVHAAAPLPRALPPAPLTSLPAPVWEPPANQLGRGDSCTAGSSSGLEEGPVCAETLGPALSRRPPRAARTGRCPAFPPAGRRTRQSPAPGLPSLE